MAAQLFVGRIFGVIEIFQLNYNSARLPTDVALREVEDLFSKYGTISTFKFNC
jgi:hypothetical protein